MRINNNNIVEVVNYLVKNNFHFAIFSLPFSDDVELIIELEKNSKESFFIQAFDPNESSIEIQKDLYFKNENITSSNIKKIRFNKNINENSLIENTNEFSQFDYEKYVAKTILNCKNNIINKGVAARIKKVNKPSDFNIGNLFVDLLYNYKSAFVNLFYHKNCGLWIGATPELLVKKIDSNNFETVALAGTKLKELDREWTSKEIEEQQIVTDYISSILKEKKVVVNSISAVETIDAGIIQHLKSTIKFSSENSLLDQANTLHPTPAVCGMPMNEAFTLIQKIEKNQRDLYSGFIGLNTEEHQSFFVNLRCMQILEKELLVYVGAGITKNSNPEKEWQETENKSQTLLRWI